MPDRARYNFRPVERADLPMLADWLRRPHVARWWGDPDAALIGMEAAIGEVSTHPFIVEYDERPIGYIQYYDPHAEVDHPYRDQPAGSLGIDMTIGLQELTGIGHGPAILRAFADRLFADGASRLLIDPNPENLRAVRAYAKAGFRHIDTRDTFHGPAYLMAASAGDVDL